MATFKIDREKLRELIEDALPIVEKEIETKKLETLQKVINKWKHGFGGGKTKYYKYEWSGDVTLDNYTRKLEQKELPSEFELDFNNVFKHYGNQFTRAFWLLNKYEAIVNFANGDIEVNDIEFEELLNASQYNK